MTMFGYNKSMETVSPLNPSAVASGNKRAQTYGLAALGHSEGEIASEAAMFLLFSGGGTALGYGIGKDWKSSTIGGLAGALLWALFGRG